MKPGQYRERRAQFQAGRQQRPDRRAGDQRDRPRRLIKSGCACNCLARHRIEQGRVPGCLIKNAESTQDRNQKDQRGRAWNGDERCQRGDLAAFHHPEAAYGRGSVDQRPGERRQNACGNPLEQDEMGGRHCERRGTCDVHDDGDARRRSERARPGREQPKPQVAWMLREITYRPAGASDDPTPIAIRSGRSLTRHQCKSFLTNVQRGTKLTC